MKKMTVILLVIISLFALLSVTAEEPKKEDAAASVEKEKTALPPLDINKASYVIGVNLGKNLSELKSSTKIEVNIEQLTKGINEGLAGKNAMTDEEMQTVMQNFQQNVRVKMEEAQKVAGEENIAKGKAFLEANKKKEGVKATESGLQYKIVKEGTGQKPAATDTVKVHYKGTLTDGTKFDSSYDRGTPAEFPLNNVIKGWTEGLQLLKVGSKAELYIPSDLGYGEQGMGKEIGPNSVLIFEIELLEIVKQAPADAKPLDLKVKPEEKEGDKK